MQKLGTRHDELTASRAGHRFHAAEYRGGSVTHGRSRAPGLAKGTYGHDELPRIALAPMFQGRAHDCPLFSGKQLP